MGVKVKSEEKEKKVEERERREGREEKILPPRLERSNKGDIL